MRGPKPTIELTTEERLGLTGLLRRHTTPQQVALRARLVLAAAAGRNNAQVARQEGVDIETARRWRGRWLGLRPVALADLSISAEQVCRIVALACEAPATSGRTISQWTGREIADEAVARGIVPTLSPRHAGRLLKRGRSSPTASATG